MNAEAGTITRLVVTGGHADDGKQFPTLVEKHEEQDLPVDIYAADRASCGPKASPHPPPGYLQQVIPHPIALPH